MMVKVYRRETCRWENGRFTQELETITFSGDALKKRVLVNVRKISSYENFCLNKVRARKDKILPNKLNIEL